MGQALLLIGCILALSFLLQKNTQKSDEHPALERSEARKELTESSEDDELTAQILAAAKNAGIDVREHIRAETKSYGKDLVDSGSSADDWNEYADRVSRALRLAKPESEKEK